MEKVINFNGQEIKVVAKHIGEKASNWNENNAHCHHVIGVYVGESFKLFDYWHSLQSVTIQDENELAYILSLLCSDASSGGDFNFSEFCSEFGYEEFDYDQECECDDDYECECDYTNTKILEIYEACKLTQRKVNSLGLDYNDLYNFLQEEYEEWM